MLLDSDGVDGAGDDHEERDKDLEGVDCLPAPSCDILTLLAPPTIFKCASISKIHIVTD